MKERMPVLIRIDDGGIVVLFPTVRATDDGAILAYSPRGGQHAASLAGVLATSRKAEPGEWGDVVGTLERAFEYRLRVVDEKEIGDRGNPAVRDLRW